MGISYQITLGKVMQSPWTDIYRPEPKYLLEPHDIVILHSLGIDPEIEPKTIDSEYDELFEHVKQIRIRRGERD